jgi:hypothetical protein
VAPDLSQRRRGCGGHVLANREPGPGGPWPQKEMR